jgi:hypothetical protein
MPPCSNCSIRAAWAIQRICGVRLLVSMIILFSSSSHRVRNGLYDACHRPYGLGFKDYPFQPLDWENWRILLGGCLRPAPWKDSIGVSTPVNGTGRRLWKWRARPKMLAETVFESVVGWLPTVRTFLQAQEPIEALVILSRLLHSFFSHCARAGEA